MATLRAKTGDVTMTLRPYGTSEEGQPSWVLTQLKLCRGAHELLSTTLSVTTDDLAELRARLKDVAEGCRSELAITTSDDDLVFEAQRVQPTSDISIGFWVGEPYALMEGYRFVARADDLGRFAGELQAEERALAALETRR